MPSQKKKIILKIFISNSKTTGSERPWVWSCERHCSLQSLCTCGVVGLRRGIFCHKALLSMCTSVISHSRASSHPRHCTPAPGGTWHWFSAWYTRLTDTWLRSTTYGQEFVDLGSPKEGPWVSFRCVCACLQHRFVTFSDLQRAKSV